MMATTAVHIQCQAVSRSILRISHFSKFQSKSLFFSNQSTKLREKTLLGKHWLAGVSKDCLNNTPTSWGSYITMEMFSTLTCAYVFLAWLEKSTQALGKQIHNFPPKKPRRHSQTIHVWYISLHLNIKIHQMWGKYTTRGWYGI